MPPPRSGSITRVLTGAQFYDIFACSGGIETRTDCQKSMTSTVTTATISALTSAAMAHSLTLISILTLLALLVEKELVTASKSEVPRTLSRVLDVGIVPLLIGFAFIVAVRVAEAMQ